MSDMDSLRRVNGAGASVSLALIFLSLCGAPHMLWADEAPLSGSAPK